MFKSMVVQSNISLIVAIAQNFAIGKNNDLLWHISDDLKRFKVLTSNHTVIMGSKTYFSLPKRPLPNRRNIVLSAKPASLFPGAEVASSIHQTLEMVKNESECFVIGGGEVYKQFLPVANRLYITWVHEDFDADVYFPQFNLNEFHAVSESEIQVDPSSGLKYSFVNYERILV